MVVTSHGPLGLASTLGPGVMIDFLFLLLFSNGLGFLIIIGLIMALGIPRRYFIDCLGWLGIPVAIVVIELLHLPHWGSRSIDYAMGQVWIVGVGLLIVAVILIRIILAMGWARWRHEPVFAEFLRAPEPGQAGQRRVLALCWGVITAYLAYLVIRRTLWDGSYPPFAYASILIFTASLWFLPRALARWLPRPGADWLSGGRAFLESFRWSMLGAVVLGAGLAGLVAREAAELAGDEPYCLQVASGRSPYRQAGTLLDLSALTMKGRFSRFHALLVVGDPASGAVYNWSYRRLGFEELPASRNRGGFQFVLNCEPQTDFAARLPLVIPDVTGWTPVHFAGRQYRIPSEFQPRSDGVYARNLVIGAMAPDFRASADAPDSGPNVLHRLVFVSLKPWPGIHDWVILDEGEEIVSEENWAGLVKQTISRPDPYSNRVRFVARDGEGVYQAVINGCQRTTAENPSLCQHRVQRGEALFTFYHSPDDLEDWQALQGRLFALFDSFEAAAAQRDNPS